jgi:hypothetical protein
LVLGIVTRRGTRGSASASQDGRSQFRYPIVSLECFWPQCGPGVDSASNRNEYQEYLLGGKGRRCVGLITLPPSRADCLEIWETQTLENSNPGKLRACPGLYRDCFTFNHAGSIAGTLSHSNNRRLDLTSCSSFFDISGESSASVVAKTKFCFRWKLQKTH